MKLALIRRQFSATGGAELYLQRLMRALSEGGHALHLFCEGWDQTPAGVTVRRMQVRGTRAQRPVRFAEAAQAILGQEKFDCVFSFERTLRQDVYRAGDGVHRVWLQRRRQFASWWRKPWVGLGAFHRSMLRLEAQTFDPRNTRHVIVNSDMVKREVLEHFAFPAERLHLVRNGVDGPRFQKGDREATRARYGVLSDEFLLLFVGSGWERKGLPFALDALKFQPDPKVKLLVVGKGRPPGRVPPNVIFAGPMAEVAHAYAAADLFVFLPIYEPSANVCFEAWAAGLPVVTSAHNGAGEIVRERENGSLIRSPENVVAVVEAIEYWRRKSSGRSVPVAIDLSLDRNVAETVAILELAAKERARLD